MKRLRARDVPDEPPKKKPRTCPRAASGSGGGGQRVTADNPFRTALKRTVSVVRDRGVAEGFLQLNVATNPLVRNGDLCLVADAYDNGRVTLEVVFPRLCADLLAKANVAFAMNDSFLLSLKGARVDREDAEGDEKKLLPMTLTFPKGVCLKFTYASKNDPIVGKIIDIWAPDVNPPPDPDQPGAMADAAAPPHEDWFATPRDPEPQDAPPSPSKPAAELELATPALDSPPKEPAAAPTDVAEPPQDDSPAPEAPAAEEQPASADQPPALAKPVQRLYRNVRGRQTRSATAAHAKAQQPAQTSASGSKDATPHVPEPPAPEPPTPEAAPPEGGSAESPGNKQTKKAQKKKAREAKKAARKGEQEGVPQEAQAQAPAEPAVELAVETSLGEKPAPLEAAPRENAEARPSTAPVAPAAEKASDQARLSQPTSKEATTPSTPASTAPPRQQPAVERSARTLLSSSGNPELSLEAGCIGENGQVYPPLASLTTSYVNSCIAVVATIKEPKKTKTEEWCYSMVLVDPSNAELDDPTRGFAVNCFAKGHTSLPECKPGDVIILTGMQVTGFHGTFQGTCASYFAWTWTVFEPERGATVGVHGTQPGIGAAERRYCTALGEWWRAVQRAAERERQASGVVTHQIGEGDARGASVAAGAGAGGRPAWAREHRLIQDASPTAQPNGYFDCTVEVLFGHTNTPGNVYSLYVTDYTRNAHVAPTTAQWCAPALAPYVLRLEAWDDAAARAAQLPRGAYVELQNVRMRVSAGGHWEGKLRERKIRVLDEDELEGEPRFAALLERKKKWEEEAEEEAKHRFPHQLISEAQLDSHFCCTVEVLNVKQKDPARTLLWVTDYTSRTDLTAHAATAEWAHGLSGGRILKITLTDAQAQVGAALVRGDVVALRNLRLKALKGGRDVSGVLGGTERLVHKLNPATTGSEECLALLSRKKAWERRAKESTSGANANGKTNGRPNGKGAVPERRTREQPAPLDPADRPKNAITLRTLRELHDGARPMWYRVVARVTDYFPGVLARWAVLRCTQCREDIPETFRICTRCDLDMAETHVRPFYRFWLEIEDEEGSRERIVGALPSSPFVPDFLEDLPPADFQEDDEARQRLEDRARPLLGSDLVDHYRELLQRADDDGALDPSDAPFLNLVLGATASDDPHLTLLKCSRL